MMKFYVIQNRETEEYFCGIQSWYMDRDINKARKFTQANWAKNSMNYHSRTRGKCSVVMVEFKITKETNI